MATVGTFTITFADTSSMTAAEAAEMMVELYDTFKRRYENDSRVTTITPTLAAAAISLAVV